ncbi:MAG: carboxypeptidase regulatory-like protein [Acidobacteriaceae bacterium]|nr:carboxypeptidase regulatory-like protein [Acidobacteriaceae bacterium]
MQHSAFTASLCRLTFRTLPLTVFLLSAAAYSESHPASATAVLSAETIPAAAALPNAPSFERLRESQPAFDPPEPQSTASISGTVLDIREGLVSNARVSLETPSGTVEQTETSDSSGAFVFKNVPPGNYKVRISAPGLETFLSYELTLHPGERHELPRIALPIASGTSDVTVTATQDQIATEQIHAQIQQRALGVFPNFYTSYLWNPAPLKAKHKFYLALRSTTDPVNFMTTGIVAGIEQARNTHPGYGDGIDGFARRYGADFGNIVIGRFIGGAVFPSIFRQDPRYFYQGSGSVTSRSVHAVGSTFVTRGDNGHNQFNYSYLLGISAAAAITNLYYPDNDRTAGTIVQNVFIRIGTHSFSNLLREFISRQITTKVPDYATGKPEATPKPGATP